MKLQTITDIYWKWKDLSDFDIIYWKDFKNMTWKETKRTYFKIILKEEANIKDNLFIKYFLIARENLGITENLNSSIKYFIKFLEDFNLHDSVSIKRKVKLMENFKIFDNLLKYLSYIFSDFYIFSSFMRMPDYESFKNKPYGYTAFQDLIVGEYEYKESLVKLMISSVVNSPKLYISKWIYNIDIPDIIDKGNSIYITNEEWQYIKFNVKFYYIPDVVCQIIGGNNIQTRVVINEDDDFKITTDGFYYKIVDNSSNIIKNQKIHWQAIGVTLNGKNKKY